MTSPIEARPGGGLKIQLTNPTSDHWDKFIEENFELCPKEKHDAPRVCRKDEKTGKQVVICGAGPSLRDPEARRAIENAVGQIWACNSALGWLKEQGLPVTHGLAIDQTDGVLNEWAFAEDVKYLLASSCNPQLTRHLLAHGRHVTFFHNYVGSPNEMQLYRDLWGGQNRPIPIQRAAPWPPTVMVGDGLNSVNRAACLAKFMGFAKITLLGADCGWKEQEPFHANGDGVTAHGATPVVLQGEIDDRMWYTKPDMLFSAVALARFAKQMGSRLKIIGDTLPNALVNKPDSFLRSLADLGQMDAPPVGGQKVIPKGRDFTSDLFERAAV